MQAHILGFRFRTDYCTRHNTELGKPRCTLVIIFCFGLRLVRQHGARTVGEG